MNCESDIQQQIRLELGKRPDLVVVFRNNIGNAIMARGGRVSFGVGGPGGADLIGFAHTGRFVAIEVKTPSGKLSVDQQRFRDLVIRMGGIYRVMRSVADAAQLLHDLSPDAGINA